MKLSKKIKMHRKKSEKNQACAQTSEKIIQGQFHSGVGHQMLDRFLLESRLHVVLLLDKE